MGFTLAAVAVAECVVPSVLILSLVGDEAGEAGEEVGVHIKNTSGDSGDAGDLGDAADAGDAGEVGEEIGVHIKNTSGDSGDAGDAGDAGDSAVCLRRAFGNPR